MGCMCLHVYAWAWSRNRFRSQNTWPKVKNMHKMRNTNPNSMLTTWTQSAHIPEHARVVKTCHHEQSLKSAILVDLHNNRFWLHSWVQWYPYTMWRRNELNWNVKSQAKGQQTDTTSCKLSKWLLRGKFEAKWSGNLMGGVTYICHISLDWLKYMHQYNP